MRKTILSLMILSTIVLISGCGYSNEEKKYMKELEKKASENAINYIQEKYGFSASIISTKVEKVDTDSVPDFSPDPTGNIFVYLSYNDKKFEVYISGKEETVDGMDNYQYDEILNDTIKYVNEKTNLVPYKSLIYYGYYYDDRNHNGLIKEFYTKSNLEQIIDNNHFKILVEYINSSNLEYLKSNEVFNSLKKTKIILVNFNSKEDYDIADTRGYNLTGTYHDDDFIQNALYIESAYAIDYGETYYYDLDVKDFNGLYFYENEKELYNPVEISNSNISNVSNWIGKGVFENVKQVSNAYLLNNIDGKIVYIYFPIKTGKEIQEDFYDVGVEHCGEYRTFNVDKVGKYLVSSLSFNSCDYEAKDAKFTLLYSTYEK